MSHVTICVVVFVYAGYSNVAHATYSLAYLCALIMYLYFDVLCYKEAINVLSKLERYKKYWISFLCETKLHTQIDPLKL